MNRNRCLDFLKGVCCIAVVIMHCPFPSKVINLFTYALKIAVPIFFLISGYFSYNVDREIVNKKLKHKIMHILKLLIISELIYGIYFFIVEKGHFEYSLEIIKKIFLGTFFNRYVVVFICFIMGVHRLIFYK